MLNLYRLLLPSRLSFIGDLVGDVVGGLIGYEGQKETNQSNARMAQKQMDFQKMMSDTSHQREVKDLLKAGLNPILSGTGGHGAVTPPGAMAVMGNELGAGVSGALGFRRFRQEMKNLAASEENTEEDTALKRSQGNLNSVDYNVRLKDQDLRDQQVKTEKERTREQKALADIAISTAKGAKVEGEIDESKYGELMRYINRALKALGVGASSAGQLGRGLK